MSNPLASVAEPASRSQALAASLANFSDAIRASADDLCRFGTSLTAQGEAVHRHGRGWASLERTVSFFAKDLSVHAVFASRTRC